MGGKGGDSGGGGGMYSNEAMASRGIDVNRLNSDKEYGSKVAALGYMSAPEEPAPVVAEPEPVKEEAVVEAPVEEAPVQTGPPVVPDAPLTPPASLPVPGAGDTLGGAVAKPPKYWVGGMDQFESEPRTGRGSGAGALRTTQT